jgi:hypothetical protein
MKFVVIGAHLYRGDVEPLATALPVGQLFLSALEVADDQPLGDRDLLLRIAALRARLLDVATFVAIRYGFSVGSAGEAESKIAKHLERWRRLLIDNRDNVEMTLKVAAESAVTRPDRHDFTSGADYLRALHAASQSVKVDDAFRRAVESLFAPHVDRKRWMTRDEKSMELAMLLPRGEVDALIEAGRKLRAEQRETPFLLSGPWPLEVFADDDHE